MNYHNISYPDMNNGDGLRVVLWLSGCSHHCNQCQNQQTWEPDSGIKFDDAAKEELFEELKKDYISGITFSGGDPLHEENIVEVYNLIKEIRLSLPEKTIWVYTGYRIEDIWIKKGQVVTAELNIERHYRNEILKYIDVLVDGQYIDELRDITLHWRGSSNQRVIDVKKTLEKNEVVLYEID